MSLIRPLGDAVEVEGDKKLDPVPKLQDLRCLLAIDKHQLIVQGGECVAGIGTRIRLRLAIHTAPQFQRVGQIVESQIAQVL